MFEDSLVESKGRIRTHSRRYAIGSFALQALLLTVLVLVPYFYPSSLPKQSLAMLLAAPPPPSAPASTPQAPTTHAAAPAALSGLTVPRVIPRSIAEGEEAVPAPPSIDLGMEHQGAGQVPGAISLLGSAPPLPRVVTRAKPAGPIRVSAGVAEGHLLAPIEPVYPAIAKAAGIQGMVVIEATISKQGRVKQARVVSGPPMLAQPALAAVERARYQPYRLNGEPVEVETTINIVFTLDNLVVDHSK